MGTAAAAAAVSETGLNAGSMFKDGKRKASSRKEEGLRVRFLGTGAADWKGPDDRGEYRRLSSVLLDNRILIDFTSGNAEMLPEGCKPECIFYTHSHADHYNPEALLKLGVPKAYLGKTWISKAWGDFAEASRNAGVQAPEIVPLSVGETTVCGDIAITALPANHAINATEQALIYLIEKGPVRVIYATDTGGIMGVAARIAGIDPHVKNGRPITGLIMEAFPYTVNLAIMSAAFAWVIGLTAGIIAAPVGFVHVCESKHMVKPFKDIPKIIVEGRKGGSNLAATLCNAILTFDDAAQLKPGRDL